MDKPNSPPAFPVADSFGNIIPGMTLRDWFAGQAIGGLVQDGMTHVVDAKLRAEVAYRIADAMLAERGRS